MEDKARVNDLCGLGIGCVGRIAAVRLPASDRCRLCELGFNPGSGVVRLGMAAFGDPLVFLARDRMIAIRKRDAKKIFIFRE